MAAARPTTIAMPVASNILFTVFLFLSLFITGIQKRLEMLSAGFGLIERGQVCVRLLAKKRKKKMTCDFEAANDGRKE